MSASSFKLLVRLERELTLAPEGNALGREEFYDLAWAELGTEGGLQGIHEGTVLADQAHELGLETESWTVDSGEAPRERDWIQGQADVRAELYFADLGAAERAQDWVRARVRAGVVIQGIIEQPAEDWNAKWRALFTGAEIPPFWRVIPSWEAAADTEGPVAAASGGLGPQIALRINPGAGFGTGTHETTQLCLQALGELSLRSASGPRDFLADQRWLDFGAGSGILAVGAARLGARVAAVEIDELAIDNARENAQLNEVADRIAFARALEALPSAERPADGYHGIFANILRPVLLEFAERLVGVARIDAPMILSGLIASDVPSVIEAYRARWSARGIARASRVLERGEWRAIVFSA